MAIATSVEENSGANTVPNRSNRIGSWSAGWISAIAALALAIAPAASAATIDIGSASGGWTVSGAGATDAVPFILPGGGLSITSNARRTGTFVDGATLANFNGFWSAKLTFDLPATATDVRLSFSNLGADDRVVFGIMTGPSDGVVFGNAGINVLAAGTLVGSMKFEEDGVDEPFTFHAADSAGTVTGPFTIGGPNTLIAIINNTGSGAVGTTRTFGGDGDGAVFRLQGSVTFSEVPEPAGMGMASGLLVLVTAVGRRTRRYGK
jgi:hypothetical protein